MLMYLQCFFVFAFIYDACSAQPPASGECQDTPLGVADRSIIEDNRFTASSYYNNYTAPHTARLHGTSGWMTYVRSNPNEYLQIDLGALFIICAVATQGLDFKIWTTEYKISTSIDNTAWTTYQSGGKPKFFQGNKDHHTVIKHTLDAPTQARFIRFIPTKYYNHKALRVEVYGSKKVVLDIKGIRLSGGSTPNQGHLEVQYEKGGQWGKVCTKKWTIKESTVACNMLGMTGKASPWSMPLIAELPTVLTSMGSCSGNEKSLANCTLVYVIRRTCSTFLIRGVSCGPPSGIVRNAKNMTTAANKTLNKTILHTTASTCPTNKTSTKESVNRFLRHLERSVYIHTVTMNRSCQARNTTRQYYVLPVVNLYDINSGRTIRCNVTMDTEDEQTAKCSMEFKTNTVEICSSDENVPLNFCSEPDVLAFDTFKNMHGVSYDLWNKYITSDKNSILKMNDVFTGPPNISSVSPSFTVPGFSGLLNYSVQEKGYVMVTYHGLYFISVSCGNECEIWLRRAEEPGLDDEGTGENLLIKIESPTYPNKYELSRNQYKFLNFSKCHLYHMKAYMRQRVNADYLTVVLRRPGEENNKLFPTEYLYWMRPGFRVLKFNLTNNISRKIDLGSEITLDAVYEFCCKGPKCPSCPIKLKLRLFGQSVMVNRKLEMDCQQHNITYKTDVVVQPGNYSIDIIYSYLDDITHWQGQRTIVKSIAVSDSTRLQCSFNRGKCPGWTNTSAATGLWTERHELSGNKRGFVALTSPGASSLESPTMPWNSDYKNISQCVEFSYLLPTNTTSRLEVFTKTASKKELLWLVSGYHGMKWKRANIPVKSKEDFQVTLRGDSETNGSLSIAVRDFQVASRSCSLGPTFAKPGFKCKVTEFKCANGQCINKKQRCNGNHGDCPDDSDEHGCVCQTSYFSCSNDKCIKYTSLCNGIRDCQDGEDEHHCEQKCPKYQCLDGTCKSCSQETSCKDDTHHHYCDAISIKQMPNVTIFCEIQGGTCGFDSQLCSLQSDTNASLHWKFVKPVDNNNKFPDHDHTSMTNRGSYVYLKSNGKMKTGRGRLVKRWNMNYTVCMQFWYFITEQSDSSIEISIGTATNTSLLWKTNNSTSSDWAFGQVEIPAGNSPGKVIISGCVSKHFVALDDLGFIEGGCASINSQQNPSCYFNKNEERGWDIANTWTLNKESVDSYLSLSKSLNVTSVVSSPLIHPRSEGWRCLRFWFYSGKIYFRRRLAVKFETENETTEEWSYRSETNKWTFIQLPILEKERLKIKIHGIKYQNAILAIDNITFLKEDCKRIPVHRECQEYKSLSFSDRRKDAIAADQLFRVCDDHLSRNTWYRFIASAGSHLASSCIAKQSSCSTENMGWVNGLLPSVEDGIVLRQLCFATEDQCCNRQTTIKIRNCKEYVVYQFPKKLFTCPSRYCGVYKNECQDTPLGVANRSIIEDNRFTASSHFSDYGAPHKARLHGTHGWLQKNDSDPNEYLQIDLGALFIICAVATQGINEYGGWIIFIRWTTEYKISTSIDNTTWTTYQSGGKPKT